ncbi:type VI secretion system Vgr family protein [Sandaracinobacteroides saxicola]|uniref:Type VI secretion system tip protein VgrG n=1 Tax=Sandaracinobacteroides saxicola TaxID=2759707 RepID=A0A7G5IJ21_9SPHN|nr:type VI secretion system tip protein TssI/VgrG [Sandaracinobacteroides saxicola]QMW23363.1 type VI secretion system tip protein VgrG [Sandaracinobacteroides saxicola]
MPSSANRIGRLHCDLGADALILTSMTAVERLSELFVIEVECISRGKPAKLQPMLSTMMHLEFDGLPHVSRIFHGMLTEYAELGRLDDGDDFVYRLVLRPGHHLWALNRTSAIYYKKSLTDLITQHGGNWRKTTLSASYPVLEYRVQYDESNFAFLSRWLEREGVYYYYNHSPQRHEITFVDAPNAHPDNLPKAARLESGVPDGKEALVWNLHEHRALAATASYVDDYDFTAPTVALKKEKKLENLGKPPKRFATSEPAEQAGKIAPITENPANFLKPTADMGQRYATVRLESARAGMARSYADSNMFAAAVGRKLTLHSDESDANHKFNASETYLIVATRHLYTASGLRSDGGADEEMHVELELMPITHPFRPERKTPQPRIWGPQTGVVIGPQGEEIHTDKYGRVKVRFFWDEEGKKAEREASSLFIRVMQTGAGSGYGAFMIPRIGHEVVVEFLNGDPDRPLVTGGVYNESNLPAYGSAPTNTQQGIRTNSSKGGGGFNEIKFDDKKDQELFYVQAQHDLTTKVVTGDEKRDIMKGHRTTVIHEGDETMTVTKGKRTTKIKGDETTTIESGNVVHTVQTGNVTRSIKTGKRTTDIMGDDTLEIKTGNKKSTIKVGNHELTVSLGNSETTVSLGNHKTTAMQSIELKCGPSSIKLTPMGIELKGMMIKIDASLMLETKGLMVQQQASAIHIVKGALVMIN